MILAWKHEVAVKKLSLQEIPENLFGKAWHYAMACKINYVRELHPLIDNI